VSPTEQIAKPASKLKTGLIATLRGLLHAEETGAPRFDQRSRASRKLLLFAALGPVLGALALTAAPAMAAPPESPGSYEPYSITATGATLQGNLNPHAPGELGDTYQFVYSPSSTECKGAGEARAPEPAAMSFGSENEYVSQTLTDLTQLTEYTACVVVRNGMGQEAVGTSVTFKTSSPEPPELLDAAPVTATGATLHGLLNPKHRGEAGSYEFLYRQSTSECEGEGHAGGKTFGNEQEAVSAAVVGLTPGKPYTVCLRVDTESEATAMSSPPVTFTTAPAPAIESASTANLTATAVELTAEVNPNGEATTCAFEYGTSTSYQTSIPCEPADIGSGTAAVFVSHQLEGLSTNTTYHWRVVANNATGTTDSPDHTFTYSTTGGGLPDNREYELVTPPVKNGASVGDVVIAAQYSISDDGQRLIAPSIQCFASSESCTGERQNEGEPFEFTRTPSGWVTTPLAPPATQFSANTAWEDSAEAGTALFTMPTLPGGEDDWYAREPDGTFRDIGPATPVGTTGIGDFSSEYMHATADLSRLVYSTRDEAWPFDQSGGQSLHEYYGIGNTKPFLVGVTGGQGSTELISLCGTALGGVETPSALSADGRMVYFTAKACEEGGSGANAGVAVPASTLYARIDGEASDAHTVAISQPECGESVECKEAELHPSGASFAIASEDGSQSLFLDTQQLTPGATQGTGSALYGCPGGSDCNLYEYDFSEPSGHNLIDISAGDSSGLGPRVQGVVAMSPDGSHVYFVAKGILSSTPNNLDQSAVATQDNLYLYERDSTHPEGHLAFVADLPDSDSENWGEGNDGNSLANVTPEGRFLVFSSHGDLTADDTRTDGSAQIFRYDAETGELVRISVGEQGFDDDGNGGTGNATIVSADRAEFRSGPSRGDPTMSDDGSYIFFESPVALTPQALNDVPIDSERHFAQNVYEYHEGRVYLISDGRDLGDTKTPCKYPPNYSAVCLLGTDTTGTNVFFTSSDQLVPADTDTQTDIYDARICTTAAPCVAPAQPPLPPCGGEACHGIPAATPSQLAPGSASFNGPGDIAPSPPPPVKPLTRAQKLAKALHACRSKRNKRKRAACEVSARKRYSPAKAKPKTAGKRGRAK
jgi:hypothetical protein